MKDTQKDVKELAARLELLRKELQDSLEDAKREMAIRNGKAIGDMRKDLEQLIEDMRKLIEGLLARTIRLEEMSGKSQVDGKLLESNILQNFEKKWSSIDAMLANRLNVLSESLKRFRFRLPFANFAFAFTGNDFDRYRDSSYEILVRIYGVLRKCTTNNVEGCEYIVIYFIGGYAVIFSSQGSAGNNLPLCMGVYRLYGTYADRPVYKKAGGEMFLYYNPRLQTWMVGAEVGKDQGWLKNSNPRTLEMEGSSVLPNLMGGWQYQPMGGALDRVKTGWMSDDPSLKLETVKGKLMKFK